MTTLLEIAGLARNFGGVRAVAGFDLAVEEGELVSIIGPNGAGKTTVFNLLTGLEPPDGGRVIFAGRDITGLTAERVAGTRLARTFQHGRVFPNLSVLDNVLVGAHVRLATVHLPWLGPFGEILLALVQPAAVKAEEASLRSDALRTLALFGDRLSPRAESPAFALSYANRRRLEIARALFLKPRLLLLDEPTAGMNPTETQEMLQVIRALKETGITVLLIEHKLDLVLKLSDRVVVMDDGVSIAEGAPIEVAGNPRVIEAYLGRRRASEREAVAPLPNDVTN